MTTPPIIAVFNAKGGVGKTTTAVNVAACLAAFGRRVVVVDLDAQGNATSCFAARTPTLGTYDLITGKCNAPDALSATRYDGISLIGATDDLGTIDVELAVDAARRGGVLRDLLSDFSDEQIDVILIDCPPAVSTVTVNALSSAHAVLVPANPTPFAHDGLMRTWRMVKRLAAAVNPGLYVAGILLTQAEAEADWSIEDVIRAEFGGALYPMNIPHDPKLFVDSSAYGLPACVFDPASAGAGIYLDLAERLLHDEPRLRRAAADAALDPPALPHHDRAHAENILAGWNAQARADGLFQTRRNVPETGTALPPPIFSDPTAAAPCTVKRLLAVAALGAGFGGCIIAFAFLLLG